jgi:hypothetical protein
VVHYQIPSVEDLIRLGERHPGAVTIYLSTAPTPQGRELAFAGAKSAIDQAIRNLRDAGASHAEQEALRTQWTELANDSGLWANLSNSLVILLAPGVTEEYVLANRFEPHTQLGDHFDLAPLVRAVTTPQRAFALTLSSKGWNLWTASEGVRASELPLVGEHAEDAADATNRTSIRGRQLLGRLGGDEGQKVLLDRYAQVVAEAVRDELGRIDAHGSVPLFVFANEPLLSMVQGHGLPGTVVAVPGAADELRPDQIDQSIRDRIGGLTAAAVSARADRIGNGFAAGLAVTDLAQLARAAAVGAVDTLIYDITTDTRGTLDEATGSLQLADDGTDLLSRLAVQVLRGGGEVVAVRPGEVDAGIWNGRLLAGLRHPLA